MGIVRVVLNIVVFLAVIGAAVFGLFVYKYMQIQKPPENNPTSFVEAKGDKPRGFTVVCAGDSITHGRISANYISILRDMYASVQYDFINAGINGDLAYNLLQRTDEIVACLPNMVTILIGTNDATGTFSEELGLGHVKRKKLPEPPTIGKFQEYLTETVRRLKQETEARIVLISIPPIGEDPDHPVYAHSRLFRDAIQRIAEAEQVDYIPLWEDLDRGIRQLTAMEPEPYEKWRSVMYTAIVKKTVFGVSYETIARTNGFIYHVDHLHLNRSGTRIIADAIERYIAALRWRGAL